MFMDDSVTLPSLASNSLSRDKNDISKNAPTVPLTISAGVKSNQDANDDNLSVDSHGSFIERNINSADTNQLPQQNTAVTTNPPSNNASVKSANTKKSLLSHRQSLTANKSEDHDVDDASSVTSFTRRRNDKRSKDLKGTLLLFYWYNGERQEKELVYRPATYSEVQREIAKFFPKCLSLFVIQDAKTREKVFPNNFKPMDMFIVREVLYPPPETRPLRLLKLPTRWEGEDYHDSKYRRGQEAEQASNDIWGTGAGMGTTGGFQASTMPWNNRTSPF